MKTKKWIIPVAVIVVFVILMLIGTFFDLQISKTFADLEFGEYYSKNFFGLVFEVIGELPVYILACFCALIIMHNINNTNKFLFYLIKTFFFLLASGAMFLVFYKAFGYIFKHIAMKNYLLEPYVITVFIIFAMLISYVIFKLLSKFEKQTLTKLLTFAVFSILVIALSNAITQGIKPIFTRERFRTIKYLNDTSFAGYTPWYLPNKNVFEVVGVGSDAFKSFPSGHTTSGASVLCLLFLFDIFPNLKTKRKQILLYATVCLWITLVALSRIVMGAHFFSDVVFGAFVTIFSFILFRFLYLKKNDSNNAK